MRTSIASILPLFPAWIFMGVLFFGMGLLLSNMVGRPRGLCAGLLVLAPWLGWAAALAVLQVWHLVLPVDQWALALLLGLSLVGYLSALKSLSAFVVARWRALALGGVCFLPVLGWVASHCANQPGVYDCGLYHLSAIRWAREYPIVPGLALLHGRLGLNNSSALYAALLEQGWFTHKAHQLAGGFLVLLLFARGWLAVLRWSHTRIPAIHEIFYALAVVPVAIWVVNTGEVSSPTPDTMVFLLGFVIAGELLIIVSQSGSTQEEGWESKSALQLALLVSVGVACKVNFAVPGAVAMALAIGAIFKRHSEWRERARVCAAAAAIAAAVLIPWSARGVILSGYPAYPATAGGMPVEWKVPVESVKCQADWIKAWARDPGRPKEEVLGTWTWVGRWFARETRVHKADVVTPLIIGAVGVVLALRRRRIPGAGGMTLFFLFPLSAIAFTFATAPNPRFAGPAFWIVGLAGLSWFVCSLPRSIGWRVGALWAAAMLAVEITAGDFPGPWRRDAGVARAVPMKSMITDSGLKIFVPETGDQCWDAPLPCTPYFSPSLRLRKSGDLSRGFTRAPVASSSESQ